MTTMPEVARKAKPGKGHPLYNIWIAMRQRCQNPNNADYPYYGMRGIRVCERWESFPAFVADMGERPTRKHSLDRENNDGPYDPDNCRWATAEEQRGNTRKNLLVEYEGETRCLRAWSRVTGLNYWTLIDRYNAGLRGEALFSKNVGRWKKHPSP